MSTPNSGEYPFGMTKQQFENSGWFLQSLYVDENGDYQPIDWDSIMKDSKDESD